jgi:hypothetical protein
MENKKNEIFIDKAKKIHGEKYNYDKVDYINNQTPVLIGYNDIYYEVKPQIHLKGCRLENIKKKYDLENFIKESNQIHNNKYDYSNIKNFESLKRKDTIICPKHGEFEQSLYEHITGHGCNRCGKESMSKKRSLSHDDIIQKIKDKHNDKYKYVDSMDLNLDKELTIICEKHGEFKQKVKYHIQHGCKKCGYENSPNMGLEKFIEKSNIVHENFYDYSKFTYKNSSTKSTIICPEHGEFEQTPNVHLRGSGCLKCGYEKNGVRLELNDFFDKCKEVHNNKYRYDETVYTTTRDIIKIFCPKHGEFTQTASSHLYGKCGCSRCKESKGENKIRIFLKRNNIIFEQEKTFDNCFHKSKLIFDFYIPENNLCIEFDGIQHFKPMSFFGGKEGYEDTIKRDGIKNKFCLENNIDLIRISYKEIRKIEEILKLKFNV